MSLSLGLGADGIVLTTGLACGDLLRDFFLLHFAIESMFTILILS